MARSAHAPLLLTPGPVSVSGTTKAVMLLDRASGDEDFSADLRFARAYLLEVVNATQAFTAIPVPGSATYANEAAIALLVPPGRKLLIHSNGVYGDRLVEICEALGIPATVLRTGPFAAPDVDAFRAALHADAAISHVMLVHCETSTGMMNPLEEVAALCRELGRGLLVDAVASFGANPIDAKALGLDAVILSSNKCMQGVPGCGWALIRTAALDAAGPGRRSLSLDLRDQNQHMDTTGTFRFTPPTQVVAAFAQACREHAVEGGSPARLRRYEANWRRLVDGMRQMGFRTVVPDTSASPIVATFHNPDDPAFSFEALNKGMKARGFVIFPGRLALANTFRIGCMGAVTEQDIGEAMAAVAEVMAEMGLTRFGHAPISA